jgi:hypothetical protein
MASYADIAEVRLSINDPVGGARIVSMEQVSDIPDPDDMSPQTAYKSTSDGQYYAKVDGVVTALPVQVSDSRILGWIDDFGIDGAIRRSVQAIIAGLASQLQLVRNSDGAESSEFIKLNDLHTFYRNMLADLPTESAVTPTGMFMRTVTPVVAGGNL